MSTRTLLAGVCGALLILASGKSAKSAQAHARPFSCYTYDGYKHDITFYPDDHIHGQGSPGGPSGYWEIEESTNWRSDGTNHTDYIGGRASEDNHMVESGCGTGNG